jgi:uncharacterized membrane protein YbhN (UPF0104 family)
VNKKLRYAISGLLLAWVGWHTNWQQVGSAFAHMHAELWLAALAVLIGAQMASAWRWQLLSRALGFERTAPQMFGYYFIGMYFNLLLPTSVGGDVVRAWYLDGGTGHRLAALAAVFVDRCSGLVVLGSTACALLCCAAAPLLARYGGGAPQRLQKVRVALTTLTAPGLLAGSTLLSLAVQAGNVCIVFLLGEAIGAQVPFAYYWILVPMVSLLTMLPVSINGTGVREEAMVWFLAPLGVGAGTAVPLALLWFSVALVSSLMGGLVYLFGRFERPVAAAPAEGEADNGPVRGDSDQGRTRQYRTAA